jgi:transcriptional regulator with XRE-family HTH domain
MARGHFDSEGFQAALDGVRQTRKKTWKQLADESQVSASTLTRMGQGRRPDVDSLAALAKWSGIDLDEFVIDGLTSQRAGGDTLAELTALFRADPNLTHDAKRAIETTLKVLYERLRTDADE